jgi:hypothetical protein
MKRNFKGTLVLSVIIGAALFYSACKKTNNTPAPVAKTQTASADVISSQIATNLAQSFAGAYGGVKLSDGMSMPTILSDDHHGHEKPNPLCGFTVDTALHYDTNVGDTIKSHSDGRIIFYFNCFNGKPAGFLANDSLKTVGTAPGYNFLFDITQYYVIKSLNANNTLLFVNGALKSFVDITYSQAGIKPTSAHTTYLLTGLTIDLSDNNDIKSGIAPFVSTGSNNYGSWSFIGVVKFLGNHKADVVINGKTYHVTI